MVDRVLVTLMAGEKDWRKSLEYVSLTSNKTLSQVCFDFMVAGFREYCRTLTLSQHLDFIADYHGLGEDDLAICLGVDESTLAEMRLGCANPVNLMRLARLHPVLRAEELGYLKKGNNGKPINR